MLEVKLGQLLLSDDHALLDLHLLASFPFLQAILTIRLRSIALIAPLQFLHSEWPPVQLLQGFQVKLDAFSFDKGHVGQSEDQADVLLEDGDAVAED